jgi:hypothetical protein
VSLQPSRRKSELILSGAAQSLMAHPRRAFRFLPLTGEIQMPETNSARVEQPMSGVKGLAMMAPFIGVPMLFHALSGTVITGLGFATVASALTPFKDDLLKVAKSVAKEISSDLEKKVPAISPAKNAPLPANGVTNGISEKGDSNNPSENGNAGLG